MNSFQLNHSAFCSDGCGSSCLSLCLYVWILFETCTVHTLGFSDTRQLHIRSNSTAVLLYSTHSYLYIAVARPFSARDTTVLRTSIYLFKDNVLPVQEVFSREWAVKIISCNSFRNPVFPYAEQYRER